MCQGFSHFSVFLHHFVMAKLATNTIRVKQDNAKKLKMTPNLKCWYSSDRTLQELPNEHQHDRVKK